MNKKDEGPNNECKIEDCSEEVFCRGWCKSHYYKWYKHGDPLFSPGVCGCGKKAYSAKGLCRACVMKKRWEGNQETLCSLCSRKHYAKGLCRTHYERLKYAGSIENRKIPDLPNEEWRDIKRPDCWGLKISNMGRIKSCRKPDEKLFKTKMRRVNPKEKQLTRVAGNGNGGNILVHMEVLRAFHPNVNGDFKSIFIDGDRENCRADNLRWYSQYSELANGMTAHDDITIFHELIHELVDLFKKKKPHRINEKWVRKNGKAIHQRITAIIRKNESYNWLRVMSLLPNEWQGRWHKDGFNFKKLIDDLVAFLEEVKPQYFSAGWIQKNNYALYKRIWRNVRKDGKPDWPRIVAALPKEWQDRWVSEIRSEDDLSKKWRVTTGSYFSKEELDDVLSRYKSYLYLMTSASTKEEKRMRNEIINCLVELTQRGNNSAREYLVSILELKCSDWAMSNENISLYEMAHDDLMKKINACINNYDFGNESSFLHYLYISLEKHRRGLDLSLPLLLDQGEDGSRSLHETIIAHEDWG